MPTKFPKGVEVPSEYRVLGYDKEGNAIAMLAVDHDKIKGKSVSKLRMKRDR